MARIALDIDSTLHEYWDVLQRVVKERYGVELPYEDQRDWGITALERDAVVHCVEETHSDENILAGVPYDDLHCSFDKVSRCVELGVEVLVDDSPVNIARAREAGIVPATIVHPWNEEVVERDGVIGAPNWKALRRELDPVLERLDSR